MKLAELKSLLRSHPDAYLRFILPDGDQIPAHFHITEVARVTKRFIDCGGTVHDKTDRCVLQTWVADDLSHRLDTRTFAKILDLSAQVLPHDDLEVEVEYDCCVISQYPIDEARTDGDHIELRLGQKKTDCLAREKCGVDGCRNESETAGASSCC